MLKENNMKNSDFLESEGTIAPQKENIRPKIVAWK